MGWSGSTDWISSANASCPGTAGFHQSSTGMSKSSTSKRSRPRSKWLCSRSGRALTGGSVGGSAASTASLSISSGCTSAHFISKLGGAGASTGSRRAWAGGSATVAADSGFTSRGSSTSCSERSHAASRLASLALAAAWASRATSVAISAARTAVWGLRSLQFTVAGSLGIARRHTCSGLRGTAGRALDGRWRCLWRHNGQAFAAIVLRQAPVHFLPPCGCVVGLAHQCAQGSRFPSDTACTIAGTGPLFQVRRPCALRAFRTLLSKEEGGSRSYTGLSRILLSARGTSNFPICRRSAQQCQVDLSPGSQAGVILKRAGQPCVNRKARFTPIRIFLLPELRVTQSLEGGPLLLS